MEKDFLQSQEWRKFQEKAGKRTFLIGKEEFSASIIEHELPIVGKYFYIPRGPVFKRQETRNKEQEMQNEKCKNRNSKQIKNYKTQAQNEMQELVDLAKENKAGWIRADIDNAEIVDGIKKNINYRIIKAPHDMQPREVFVIDIAKSEEELLAEMKPKTRYNIKLAQKRGVFVQAISNFQFPISKQITNSNDKKAEYSIEEFLRLTKIMAERQGIVPHTDEYYRKMFEIIPGDILKLYIAEYEGEVVAANLMIFYGKVCTYLHGASDDKYKNLMAPYLLQWQAMKDAKNAGCERYDFGGVKTSDKWQETRDKEQEAQNSKSEIPNPKQISNSNNQSPKEATCYMLQATSSNSWAGITKFKLGFSPKTEPTRFAGSYDIIINNKKYFLYRFIQKIKGFIR